jgi:FtsP/CotA-like multicopper oxidase with cupredoxin domain
MTSRRNFFASATTLVIAGLVGRSSAATLPEAVSTETTTTQPPLMPPNGRPYNPVVTLNGWTPPWRMNNGVKEFHLVAEPVVREIAPGMKANLWGYNGQSPGPTIEVVEGDRVRIFVTNRLPEQTNIHWHGQHLPNGMDGVSGLTQAGIQPGKTFVYDFIAQQASTFMYHPHADEMTQMAMGMMGFWVTHPRDPREHAVDRDFVFLLGAYDIDPGTYTPNVNEMTNFNLWTINSRVFPGIDTMNVRQGDRVRIRAGNLTMTNHPIHLHGHRFEVTCTDGGWIRPEARWPETTIDIGVGQMRAIEFLANELGDWAFHCHKSHHTMNTTRHNVRSMIGVDQRDISEKIANLIPGYIAGSNQESPADGTKMPLPENTLPVTTGDGPFGGLGMGGMFTILKVRQEQKPGDYKDSGWYKHPQGSVAYEWNGNLPIPIRNSSTDIYPVSAASQGPEIKLNVRKPSGR